MTADEWLRGHPDANPAHESDSEDSPGFVRAGDLVAEPDEPVRWLVDQLLPSGGLSIAVAKPKVGKSRLARTVAVGVASGKVVLDRTVTAGPVVYLGLEEKKADVRRHLAALGITHAIPLYLHIGPVQGADWLSWLRAAVVTYRAVLVVVDPLARLVRVKKIEDYAELTKATEALIALAHDTGAHVLCLHHAKKGESAGTDAVLGSTALAGFPDTVLVLKRLPDGLRTLETIQRTGSDLPESIISLDPVTGMVTLGLSLEGQRVAAVVEQIVQIVAPDVRTEQAIREAVGGDRRLVGEAIRKAAKAGRVVRVGSGKRGDPYRYFRPDEEKDGQGTEQEGNSANKHEKKESEYLSLPSLAGDSGDSRFRAFSLPGEAAREPGEDAVEPGETTVADALGIFPGARVVEDSGEPLVPARTVFPATTTTATTPMTEEEPAQGDLVGLAAKPRRGGAR